MITHLKPDSQGVVGTGMPFERIRRITGYLVGTLDRFNDGKKAEEHDRVKHAMSSFTQKEEKTRWK